MRRGGTSNASLGSDAFLRQNESAVAYLQLCPVENVFTQTSSSVILLTSVTLFARYNESVSTFSSFAR